MSPQASSGCRGTIMKQRKHLIAVKHKLLLDIGAKP